MTTRDDVRHEGEDPRPMQAQLDVCDLETRSWHAAEDYYATLDLHDLNCMAPPSEQWCVNLQVACVTMAVNAIAVKWFGNTSQYKSRQDTLNV